MVATITMHTTGREVTGEISTYIDEHTDTAYVYIDDAVVVSYSDCVDIGEAIDMFEEDYEVEWESE